MGKIEAETASKRNTSEWPVSARNDSDLFTFTEQLHLRLSPSQSLWGRNTKVHEKNRHFCEIEISYRIVKNAHNYISARFFLKIRNYHITFFKIISQT